MRAALLAAAVALLVVSPVPALHAQECPLNLQNENEGGGPNQSGSVGVFARGTDYAVSVTPDGASVQRQQNTSGHTFVFTVSNTGACDDFYGITVLKTGTITAASANPTSVFLLAGTQTTVTVTYSVGTAPSGVITLTAMGSAAATDNGTLTVTTIPPPGAPIVDVTPYNFVTQNYGRCAESCFAAVHAQSTVSYFSLDAPRSVTLAYNGDRVDPKPFVHLNVSPDLGYGQTPSEYRLQVKVNSTLVTFVNGEQTLRFAYGGSAPLRIGGQFNASSYATGMYKLEILASAVYPVGSITSAIEMKLLVVNETTAPVARGWTIAGVQRLYTHGDSALITEGDGSAVYFAKNGVSFVTPSGEFSRLVTGMPGGGSGWTRLYPDSTKIVFNSTGRMIEMRDRFNNITTVTYDGSNRVWKITDPVSKVITLAYGSNGLSTITDAGSPARVTTITVDASKRLTMVRDPDNVSTNFGYDGSLRLSTITNRRGHVTALGYDAQSGKLATATPPAVEVVNTNGSLATASPVITLDAWHKKGVPYGSTGTPVAAPRADTVYGRMTDPGGHTSRFTVNRWGAPAVVTDQLGRTDSIRFDAYGLPIRVRSAVGAVDSTAYNADGLPTYRKSSGLPATTIRYAGWRQADSLSNGFTGVRHFIGANGRVDSSRVAGNTPDVAWTRYRYEARGRPDSVLDAMGHLVQRTVYAGTNGNRSKDSLPAGTVTTYGYDAYGRVTSVARSGLATTTTFYSIINRPDSVRDGVNPVATRYGYDNLFLTSVTDPKSQVYGFTYNAVGWLTQRTDPAARSDVFKYSRDGELRKWTNRRGQTITTTYDVLHRRTNKSGTNTTTDTWAYPNDTVVVATSPIALDTLIANRYGQFVRASTVIASRVFARRYVYTAAGFVDSVIPSATGLTFQARQYVWNTRRGTLTTIKLGAATTQIANNADRLPETVTLPGGDAVTYRYTAAHTEGDITTGSSYGATVSRYLNFIAPGRLRDQVFGSGLTGRTYRYDGLGRLKGDSAITWQGQAPPCTERPLPPLDPNGSVCTPDEYGAGTFVVGPGVAFAYDSAGNRRDQSGDYTTGNRITAFAGCTYQTDFDGNVTQRTCGGQTATFTWSAEARLASLTVT
ncbi:MAG: hypothetical protein ACREMF_03505, partial [Gemmatimonadales bacterium]